MLRRRGLLRGGVAAVAAGAPSLAELGPGGDGRDATDLFRAAAARAGSWHVPPGRWVVSETVDLVDGRALLGAGRGQTVVASSAPGGAFRLGHYAGLADMTVEAAPGSGAALGVVLTRAHKPRLTRVLLRDFALAGVALDGAQNALLLDVFAETCRIGFWLLNETRTITLLNSNATDVPQQREPEALARVRDDSRREAAAARAAAQAAWEPAARALVVGHFENDALERRSWDGPEQAPSNITVASGIFERYRRHDHVAEVLQCWGRLAFRDTEFTHAARSLVRLDPALAAQRRPPLVLFDACEFIGWPRLTTRAVEDEGGLSYRARLCSAIGLPRSAGAEVADR